MSNFSKLLDRFCLKAARVAVRDSMPEILQTFRSQTDSGPVLVVAVKSVNGLIKVTVKTQDGRMIEDVDPGTVPCGPGTHAILTAGRKLQL